MQTKSNVLYRISSTKYASNPAKCVLSDLNVERLIATRLFVLFTETQKKREELSFDTIEFHILILILAKSKYISNRTITVECHLLMLHISKCVKRSKKNQAVLLNVLSDLMDLRENLFVVFDNDT